MNYKNIFKLEEERLSSLKQEQCNLIKLDLLTIGQIFGSEITEQLEIFEKYGTRASITDFAVALGGYISNCYFTNEDEGNRLENRTGCWWTKSSINNNARVVYFDEGEHGHYINIRNGGCRPTLHYSSISSILSNKERGRNGILEVEYGEYPQVACSNNVSKLLEKLYKANNLNTTGKVYTTDSRRYDEFSKNFKLQKHIEYEYNGKKYVRVKVKFKSYYDGYEKTLSNGEKYKDGDYVWISVSPIKWLVDEKKI